MNWQTLRIAVVGPMPPPRGGMAGQTQQLVELLRREGAEVVIVPTNAPYRPRFLAPIRGLRAIPRLAGHIARLWSAAGKVDILHVMANSGWSWHLFAAPAIWIGRLRGRRVLVNYRGGEASAFLQKSQRWVRPSLRAASAVAVPSGFLEDVFERFGIGSHVVPNVVDLAQFHPADPKGRLRHGAASDSVGAAGAYPAASTQRTVLVARSLEPIYDIASALRAAAFLIDDIPGIRMVIAGSGPEEMALKALARDLGIENAVVFSGRLDRDQMAAQLRQADVVLNSSRVDNMPNSVLEAMASGVPIVSTDVGGVPYIVSHERTALLVPVEDAKAMAAAITRILREPGLGARLADAALTEVQRYAWPRVRDTLGGLYESILAQPSPHERIA
ncbi:MAG TPA: glycosyltransferase family 4 protein [Casimicrobiaceae bacterium]|nr:glycosyltransferase family 4 protein [Casimicrobiaceae bacterium]